MGRRVHYPRDILFSPKTKLLSALQTVFRPIANALLKVGVGHTEAAEALKTAFVRVATDNYGLRNRPTNVSRVAAMTGLDRDEVKRLREIPEEHSERPQTTTCTLDKILEVWHTDPKFIDETGEPRLLDTTGRKPDFNELVRICSDLPPGSIRSELHNAGVIEKIGGGKIRSLKRFYSYTDDYEKLEHLLLNAMLTVAQCVDQNIGASDSDSWAQHAISLTGVRSSDLPRVRNVAKERCSDFARQFEDLFAAYESLFRNGSDDRPDSSVRIAVYYVEH